MWLQDIMQKIVTLGTGLILILIAIFVVLVVREYSWDKEYTRIKQEMAETTKSVEQSVAANKRLDEEIRQSFREKERKKRKYHMSVSTAFKEGRCADFMTLLAFEAPLSTPESLLKADLYMRGKCMAQDFSKAFVLYQKELTEIYDNNEYFNGRRLYLPEEYYGHIAHIKFRLATLYWRGQGISQDKDKARALSKEAALIFAPWYASVSHRAPDPELGPTDAWHMTDRDILENVTFHATGPWDIPEPVIQRIRWLKNIHEQGGAGYLDVGLHLLKGTGGHKQDPVLAYEWLYISSHFYDFGPAHYPRAMLMRNKEFFEERQKFPIFSIDFSRPHDNFYVMMAAYDLLLSAAKSGDIRADKELLRFHQLAPAYYDQKDDIYFWILRLYQQNDPDITEETLQNFRKKLDEHQIERAEKQVTENRFPSYPIRPPKEPE